MSDGTVYRGPGGGFMVNGVGFEVRRASDIIIEQICQHEKPTTLGFNSSFTEFVEQDLPRKPRQNH